MSTLQMGHFLLVRSHWSTHSWWKRCIHGRRLGGKHKGKRDTRSVQSWIFKGTSVIKYTLSIFIQYVVCLTYIISRTQCGLALFLVLLFSLSDLYLLFSVIIMYRAPLFSNNHENPISEPHHSYCVTCSLFIVNMDTVVNFDQSYVHNPVASNTHFCTKSKT